MSAADPNAEGRCWCGAIWWQEHRHFNVAPVEFGRRSRPVLTWTEKTLLALAAVSLGVSIFFGCGCSTVKTCVQPLTAQTAADVASVAACTTTGESLAQCEDAQIAMETGQLTQDVLMCAETAVAAAVNGKHMASNSSYATKNVENSGNPADLPPVNDNVSPFAGQKKKP